VNQPLPPADDKFKFCVHKAGPLLDINSHPACAGNINGPSLIRVPDWVVEPYGRYYLYFAHHEGLSIRLAYADELTGPWTVYEPGALQLEASGFCQSPPKPEETNEEILAMIQAGIDGDYPHIASPDVHIDPDRQEILMFFHGRLDDGTQATRLAVSRDGIHFTVEKELLGIAYFRVFQHHEYFYSIALGGVLYRSVNGRKQYERGPKITTENYRHGAILSLADEVYVIWTRAEDNPERLLISRLDTSFSWNKWTLVDTRELHRPTFDWEGADEPQLPSRYGGIMTRVNQLRDPCVFQEDNHNYVIYSIAGEQGLAIGEIK